MKHEVFETRKNDVFFAFLMAAIFAVMLVGELAGALSLVHARAGAEYAKTHPARVAMGDAGERAPLVAPAGARR